MPAEVYSLFSSSSGNCCLIRNGNDLFLIDAGASAKRICASVRALGYDPAGLKAVFVTHEHADHISGLNTLSRKYGVPVYAPEGCFRALREKAPAAEPLLRPYGDEPVLLEQTRLYAVPTPHDADGSVGFRIDLSGELLAFFTDIGHLSRQVVSAMAGCERVVIESNHDPAMLWNGPYPEPLKRRIAGERGHLSNPDCARLLPHLVCYGTKRILLAHLSETNNTPALAYETAEASLRGSALLRVASPQETVEI